MFIRSCLAALFVLGTVLPAAPQTAADQRWAGRYGGLSFGAVRTDGAADLDAFDGIIIPFDVGNGIFPLRREDVDIAPIGGLFAGYAWQRGSSVLGIEADISFTGLEAESGFVRTDNNATGPSEVNGGAWPFNGATTTTRYATELDALATLRMRAGIELKNTLVYATGGLAAGKATNRFTLAFEAPLIPLSYDTRWRSTHWRVGYVVGLGVEHALSPQLGLRAEIMHFDLRDSVVKARDPVTFAGEEIDYRFANRGQTLRFGVSVRF